MAEPDSIRSSANRRGRFYVYEHVRHDSGAVFYVGKGSGYRQTCTQGRNPHWQAIAGKAGWSSRVVFRTDDEELAFLAEQELIDWHRRNRSRLTNMTDGGEGMSGYRFDPAVAKRRGASRLGVPNLAASIALKGVPKSAEHRAKLSASRIGFKASDATRMKMSKTRKGRPSAMLGKTHREESKAAISAAVSGERNPFFGKRHSEELIEQIRQKNLGRKESVETRAKKSRSRLGSKNPRFGVQLSDEQKAKQRATLMARPKVECPRCGKLASEGNSKRWHFDNCRSVG